LGFSCTPELSTVSVQKPIKQQSKALMEYKTLKRCPNGKKFSMSSTEETMDTDKTVQMTVMDLTQDISLTSNPQQLKLQRMSSLLIFPEAV
jgi:hypothetical protein